MSKPTEQDESRLFQQAMQGVTPLRPSDRQPTRSPRHREITAPRTASNVTAPPDAAEQPITDYLANGIGPTTLRDLHRSRWKVEDRLDLHGLGNDEAQRLVAAFLRQAKERGLRCIEIIHGKGHHSEAGYAVLKHHTRHWLTQQPHILAFCDAPPQAGGSGVVRVLLKARK